MDTRTTLHEVRAGECPGFRLGAGHRLKDAEAQAALAVKTANDKTGSARFLLGEIQYAEGNAAEAMKTWQKLIDDLPSDPAAATAKHKLAGTAHGGPQKNP